jgi:hypothetical protein
MELRKRSKDYIKNKENKTISVQLENVETALDHVFSDVMSKLSKRNIEVLGKFNFSAKIDFSVNG